MRISSKLSFSKNVLEMIDHERMSHQNRRPEYQKMDNFDSNRTINITSTLNDDEQPPSSSLPDTARPRNACDLCDSQVN